MTFRPLTQRVTIWYPVINETMTKLNRRSVLGVIGLVGVGTGAAFGSGAFTSTTAEREVEVNVLGADLGTAGDGLAVTNGDEGAEDDIANEITSNFADVLVDTSADTVDIRDTSGDIIGQPENVFPSFESDDVGNNGNYDEFDENYVSLVANDVRVVFGRDGLPADSKINYNPLFGFTTEAAVDVFFDGAGIGGDSSILTTVGTQTNFGTSNAVFTGAENGASETKAGDIATGTESQRVQALNVVIEPQS